MRRSRDHIKAMRETHSERPYTLYSSRMYIFTQAIYLLPPFPRPTNQPVFCAGLVELTVSLDPPTTYNLTVGPQVTTVDIRPVSISTPKREPTDEFFWFVRKTPIKKRERKGKRKGKTSMENTAETETHPAVQSTTFSML